MARLDEAVRRILLVKFQMGLFERPFSDPARLTAVGSAEHRALAREAVSKSAVLLQNNDRALPLAKDTPLIFVSGRAANDIGLQCGGWTIEWQGRAGNVTPGTTILQGIRATAAGQAEVRYDALGRFEDVTDASGALRMAEVGIVIVGEAPYAEGRGDNNVLTLSRADRNAIQRTRERAKKLIVILISGRPMIVTDVLQISDAFVAAWLPGTEGQGVADVLFGDQPFTGKLPFSWPRSMAQIPFDFGSLPANGCDAPLFPYGYAADALAASTLPTVKDSSE
jgi:beta-glucosidase